VRGAGGGHTGRFKIVYTADKHNLGRPFIITAYPVAAAG
jgi:hypothetical protein